MNKDPFREYIRESEPDKRDKGYAWHTAIGLQAVDGLKTSDYLVHTAVRNIEGEISFEESCEHAVLLTLAPVPIHCVCGLLPLNPKAQSEVSSSSFKEADRLPGNSGAMETMLGHCLKGMGEGDFSGHSPHFQNVSSGPQASHIGESQSGGCHEGQWME